MKTIETAVRAALTAALLAGTSSGQETRAVSLPPAPGPLGESRDPSISDDGRWIAFESDRPDLVPGDTNGDTDVFLYDRIAETTVRLSLNSLGQEVSGASDAASVSDDGRRVAFRSASTDFLAFDANGTVSDVFVRDLDTGLTTLVSVDSSGFQGTLPCAEPTLSGDGRWIAFRTGSVLSPGDVNSSTDIYVHDLTTLTTIRASVSVGPAGPDSPSFSPGLSDDGRYAVFWSSATDLVAGDTNGLADVFVRDLVGQVTYRASVGPGGVQSAGGASRACSISGDGRFVAFESDAVNLVAGDTNGVKDVFARDMLTGDVRRVSVDENGGELDGLSFDPSISATGQYVAWESFASAVAGDGPGADVFLHDIPSGQTWLLSATSAGAAADGTSFDAVVSANGRFAAFESNATNLDPLDPNNDVDVYLRDRFGGPSSYCTAKVASAGCAPKIGGSGTPSASGATVATITASKVLGQRAGLLFYGTQGPAALPFNGGVLCVAPPLGRTPIQFSGGADGQCNGSFSIDFSAWAAGDGVFLVPGADVNAQWWFRDPVHPDGTGVGLTNAVDMVLAP